MHLPLSKIKETYPSLEILNYNPDVVITQFNHDSRTVSQGELFIPIIGDKFDGHNFIKEAVKKGAVCVLCQSDRLEVTEGVDIPVIVTENIQDGLSKVVSVLRAQINAPVVGITGSTGKSTTRELLCAILNTSGSVLSSNKSNTLWGNARLLGEYTDQKYIVLEMGMDMLREIHYHSEGVRPDIGVILNIGLAHISRVGLDGIYKTKKELADYCVANEKKIVLNIDDSKVKKISEEIPEQLLLSVGFKGEFVKVLNCELERGGTRMSFEVDGGVIDLLIPIYGKEYASNVACAIAVAKQLGVSNDEIKSALERFKGVGKRFEVIKVNQYLTVVNDAYNANPTSMKMSIETFNEVFDDSYKRVVILGDMRELGDLEQWEHLKVDELLKKLDFDECYFVGDCSKYMSSCTKVSINEVKEIIDRYSRADTPTALLLKASNSIGLSDLL